MIEVDHQERDALVIAPCPMHLLQVALSQGTAVGQLRQLVGESVLLLRLEKLCMPNGDRALGCDPVEQVRLVFRQLPPCVQIELHRAHQLPGPLHRNHQHVLRMPPCLEARRCLVGQLQHHRAHRRQRCAQRLLLQVTDGALRSVGEVVLGLAKHLCLPRRHQVHRARDGAHDPAGVGEGDVQDLFEREGGVDS